MIKKIAKVKVNARILYRNGNIEWIKDIEGEAEEKVFADYFPISQQKEENQEEKEVEQKYQNILKKLEDENLNGKSEPPKRDDKPNGVMDDVGSIVKGFLNIPLNMLKKVLN